MCCGAKKSNRRYRPARIKHLKNKNPSMQILSEPVKTLLQCRPQHYGLNYSINPWMDLTKQVNHNLAVEQWDSLNDRLKEFGAEIKLVRPQAGLPDMVFTANAGLYLKKAQKVILSNFFFEERQKEQWWFHQFFTDQKMAVLTPVSKFEGAGDALFLGDHLIAGHGFRSDPLAYKEMSLLVDPICLVKLIDPRFYHLDTCFCPLDGMDYLIFPKAFDAESLAAIRALGGNEIEVPTIEATQFACNAVQLKKTVILPSGCEETMNKLTAAGYNPVATPMSEFIKAGGACKCLTMEI